MRNNRFSDFCRKRIKSFLNNVYKMQISGNAKTVHNIRTDIKKLRSVFVLAKMLDKNFAQTSLYCNSNKALNRIFRTAGKIREAQLILMSTEVPGIPPDIADNIKASVLDKLETYRPAFTGLIKGFDDVQFIELMNYFKKAFKKTELKKTRQTCFKLIIREIKKIQSLTDGNQTAEKPHKIRKHLKNICATGILLDKLRSNKKLIGLIRICEGEEIKLGNWHDKMIFDEYLLEIQTLDKNGNFTSGSENLNASNKEKNSELLRILFADLKKIFYSKIIIKSL